MRSTRALLRRLHRLERRTCAPRPSFWDYLLGDADPADLEGVDRERYEEILAVSAAPPPESIEEKLKRLLESQADNGGERRGSR